MIEDFYFLRESVVDIDAAVVGIGRSRWTCLAAEDASEKAALELMEPNRFDILPIVEGGKVKEYYQTKQPNDFSKAAKQAITYRDVVPLNTHVRDVIKSFADNERTFYFLSNENEVVGLITVANLNCRQVKTYLFSLLSELEIRMGQFISERIPEDELLAMTFGEVVKNKHENVKARFEEDRSKGIELAFVEYLYLSDLIDLVLKADLYENLGYTKNAFKKVNSLNDLRHAVAHPARSIVGSQDAAANLWGRIDRIEELLFKLR